MLATKSQINKLVKKLNQQPFRLKELAICLKEQKEIALVPLKIRNSIFDWSSPYVMGIVNAIDSVINADANAEMYESLINSIMEQLPNE